MSNILVVTYSKSQRSAIKPIWTSLVGEDAETKIEYRRTVCDADGIHFSTVPEFTVHMNFFRGDAEDLGRERLIRLRKALRKLVKNGASLPVFYIVNEHGTGTRIEDILDYIQVCLYLIEQREQRRAA